jgi:hypothetical protein
VKYQEVLGEEKRRTRGEEERRKAERSFGEQRKLSLYLSFLSLFVPERITNGEGILEV